MTAAATVGGVLVGADLGYRIEQFLYDEIALVDERRFTEWLALLAEDFSYDVPLRRNLPVRQRGQEFTGAGEQSLLTEDKRSMTIRVTRLSTGMAWSDEPPARTRHYLSNVRARETEQPDVYQVACNMLAHWSRLPGQRLTFTGARYDRVRRSESTLGWELVHRRILLDDTTNSRPEHVPLKVTDVAAISTRLRVCGVDELPEGEARRVEVARPVAVFNVDGAYFALDDSCTHQDYPLSEGWIEGDVVECALHMARFCIRTGKALCLPADRAVAVHPVDVVGNDIYVTIKEQ